MGGRKEGESSSRSRRVRSKGFSAADFRGRISCEQFSAGCLDELLPKSINAEIHPKLSRAVNKGAG